MFLFFSLFLAKNRFQNQRDFNVIVFGESHKIRNVRNFKETRKLEMNHRRAMRMRLRNSKKT